MRDMVRDLGIGGNVSFLGSRSDVSELQRIMDVFCLTSLKELLPISLIEAMATRFPLVGANVEGIWDVIRPATVEPENVEAL